ncbi:MAG: ATP-grasp domain-containing protein [Methylococcaceae bacterium]|nr:ATP-grasp domain-containing protein [Methylococcaceae bacterium]
MIAGIGGASLGTEICKCLSLAGRYEIYGCDISPTAYGLYDKAFIKTYHIRRENYVAEVLKVCQLTGAKWLIPGGEQPNALLGATAELFAREGIRVVTNDAAIVGLFSDKATTFNKLSACGIPIPKTAELINADDVNFVGLPCIVKPATGSGGSASVFFAVTADEALIYADFIRRNGSVPIAQEYVGDDEGEFTIGVLSLPDGRVVGSIALRRVLDAKLSIAYRGRGGLVSSGYSQGYIDAFPDLCQQAERIAAVIQSRGPINIQGRVRNGMLMPFEINPRFSASTYLRALAGFNEIDMLLGYLISGELPSENSIRPGWYLRSLTENFVAKEDVK